MSDYPPDKKILLSVADGPESIELFTSEHLAIVDMAPGSTALYLHVSNNGAHVTMGFYLPAILEAVQAALAKTLLLGGFGHEREGGGDADA